MHPFFSYSLSLYSNPSVCRLYRILCGSNTHTIWSIDACVPMHMLLDATTFVFNFIIMMFDVAAFWYSWYGQWCRRYEFTIDGLSFDKYSSKCPKTNKRLERINSKWEWSFAVARANTQKQRRKSKAITIKINYKHSLRHTLTQTVFVVAQRISKWWNAIYKAICFFVLAFHLFFILFAFFLLDSNCPEIYVLSEQHTRTNRATNALIPNQK